MILAYGTVGSRGAEDWVGSGAHVEKGQTRGVSTLGVQNRKSDNDKVFDRHLYSWHLSRHLSRHLCVDHKMSEENYLHSPVY